MRNTKIDWVTDTLNPVVGCPNGCPYCYARGINTRFKLVGNFDEPEYFPERLNALKAKRGRSIFMDSMSDVGWWRREWLKEVADKIKANPQHNYIFLTKVSHMTLPKLKEEGLYANENVWVGDSFIKGIYVDKGMDFVSIEPMHGEVCLGMKKNTRLRTVIIGAETGERKGKIIPKKEWVDNLVRRCDESGISVFMKESLREIMGDAFRQDKLFWEMRFDC